jgi:hypothetical protein
MDQQNIKRGEGGQPGNKNAEKWTEGKAIDLGEKMIEWLREKDDEDNDKGNIFFREFLLDNDLYSDLVDYLCDKYKSFSDLIKKAKEIQEIKLVKFGVGDRLQPAMTIFILKNNHGYRDKQETELTGKDGKDLFPKIEVEIIDKRNQVDEDTND